MNEELGPARHGQPAGPGSARRGPRAHPYPGPPVPSGTRTAPLRSASTPPIPPPLEPMLPALTDTVLFWSRKTRRVLVAHDEQSALTAGRLRRLQVADLLAGMARRLPEMVGDGPLQPFLSPTSLRDPQP